MLRLPRRIVGVDEAGRGPVIGPLVIAGVVLKEEQTDALIEWGVRDSKQLTDHQRETLKRRICQLALQVEVCEITPQEIDRKRRQKLSLNVLEAQWMAQVLDKIDWDVAYVDASDVNAARYGQYIQSHLTGKRKIVSEHKADLNYPIVGAASIVAKVRRDQRIRELHQTYGDFGSGYPNDPKTRRFLEKWLLQHESFPEIVRQTWATARDILSAKRQKRL